MGDAGAGEGTRRTKVERVASEYDLDGLEADLAARWSAPASERDSLRDLAEYVNERILASALDRAGVDSLSGEVENYYRLLTDDDVSAGRREEARTTLRQSGVDVSDLEADFVSHQAVHTYLTERAGVSYDGPSTQERLENARQAIARLEGRLESVAERNVGQLANAGHLDVGDATVLVSLDVVCNDCGSRYDFGTLLDRGRCDCSDGAHSD